MRGLIAISVIAGGLTVLPAIGFAQSSDDIIKMLQPGAEALKGGATRGIRPISPNAASQASTEPATPVSTGAAIRRKPAPMAKPAAATATTDSAGHAAANITVEFRTGSADLTPSAEQALDALGRALTSKDLAAYRFRIEGHTDTVGTPDANLALSGRRADAVADYLKTKFGVEPGRLETAGRGEADPVVPTPPQTPEARNRRVEVINLNS